MPHSIALSPRLTNFQKLILVDNAIGGAQSRRSTKVGVTYTTFSVGVGDAKDRTTFFPVTAFGQLGKAVAKYIIKGRQVLVEGRIKVSASGRFNVVANRIRLGASTGKPRDTKKSNR